MNLEVFKPSSLWVRVIKLKYGGLGLVNSGAEISRVHSDRSRGRSPKRSSWWLNICNLYWGSTGVGLCREFNRVVDNGERTKIWGDCWIGEESFKIKFSRLFRISSQKG